MLHIRRLFTVWSLCCVVSLLSAGSAFADTGTYGVDSDSPAGSESGGSYYVSICSPSRLYDVYLAQVASGADGSVYEEDPTTSGSYDIGPDTKDSYDEYAAGHGNGAADYYFLVGPGWEPSGYTPVEWGQYQAYWAAEDANDVQVLDAGNGYGFTYNFFFADVEVNPPYYYGWETGNTTADQQVWEGWYEELQDAGWNVGVYSSPDLWQYIMGSTTWPVSTVEWTAAETQVNNPGTCPSPVFSGGPDGDIATFFGGDGTSSDNALLWQWGQGSADYDQNDLTHWNALFGANVQP